MQMDLCPRRNSKFSQDSGQGFPVRRMVKKGAGKARKAGSGGRRLDDLLGGGFPFRSISLVQGPAFIGKDSLLTHIGKDSLLTQFIAEGIKFGIPSLIVLTHYTTSKFRKKIIEMDPKLEERERAGLVSYIDCHAKTVGLMGKNPFAIYLNGVNDLDALSNSIERFEGGYRDNYFYHRLIFDSLSSILRTHGVNKTIDFINSLSAKIKAYNGIALIDLAGGIHKSEDVSAIEHSVDGSLIMKEDNGRHYLLIKGLEDVKSGQWVEYGFNDHGFDIKGSFALSYIK
jgi:KaiC/GvpD/RAD55 family RecA-like ATPase